MNQPGKNPTNVLAGRHDAICVRKAVDDDIVMISRPGAVTKFGTVRF